MWRRNCDRTSHRMVQDRDNILNLMRWNSMSDVGFLCNVFYEDCGLCKLSVVSRFNNHFSLSKKLNVTRRKCWINVPRRSNSFANTLIPKAAS